MQSRLLGWVVVAFVPFGLSVYSFGCFTTSSPAATGGSGGSSSSTSTSSGGGLGGGGGAGGGNGGQATCDGGCPPGSTCGNSGVCSTVPSCDAGTDCLACTDLTSCASCNAIVYPGAWQAFVALRSCVLCTACYGACAGGSTPGLMGGEACPTPPSSVDPCDVTDGGVGQCGNCSQCATDAGTCAELQAQCEATPDCMKLAAIIAECPGPSDAGAGGGSSSGAGGSASGGPADAATD